MIPSMKEVSMCLMRVSTKIISLRVFSKMSLGSASPWQRRMLGAITMARLVMSIFVIDAFSGAANT